MQVAAVGLRFPQRGDALLVFGSGREPQYVPVRRKAHPGRIALDGQQLVRIAAVGRRRKDGVVPGEVQGRLIRRPRSVVGRQVPDSMRLVASHNDGPQAAVESLEQQLGP